MKSKILNVLAKFIPFHRLKFLLPQKFILYTHVISDKEHFVKNVYRYPSFKEFDELISLFKNEGYEFVDLERYLASDEKKKILLTIDDGFKIVKDEMHEKLKERKLPYVLFITSKPLIEPGFIFPSLIKKNQSNELNRTTERLFLSYEEINYLKKDGVHIGFHTKSHQLLREETDATKSDEIEIDERFKSLFSQPLIFSYPYFAPSNYQVVNKAIAQQINARYFFDTKGFKNSDGNHFFRVCIDSPLSSNEKNNCIHVVKEQLLKYGFHILFRRKKILHDSLF